MHGVSVTELRRACLSQRLFVAVDSNDWPLGFALGARIGAWAQLAEIDVRPEHTQKGLGQKLVRRILVWARDNGFERIVLSTMRSPPWNAPFYRKLGFVEIGADELVGPLRRLRTQEARLGFPMAERVLMWKRLR